MLLVLLLLLLLLLVVVMVGNWNAGRLVGNGFASNLSLDWSGTLQFQRDFIDVIGFGSHVNFNVGVRIIATSKQRRGWS